MNKNENNFMSNNKFRTRQRILMFIFVLSLVPLFFISKSMFTGLTQIANKKEKKVTKETFKNDPIEFIELKSNGMKFNLNKEFTQQDNWLKDFTIKFKNVSGKSVVYADIAIGFPETESTGQRMGMSLNYGVNPRAQKEENGNEIKLLLPGEIGEVSLSPKRFTILEKFIATRHSLSSLKQLHLTTIVVYFEDGTYWSAGSVFRPDPNNPKKFVVENSHKEQKQ
jgi:hypothetical protein